MLFSEPEPECKPPYKKVNLQCVLVPEDDKEDAPKEKKTFKQAIESCHIFEGALPYTLLSNSQLYPNGNPIDNLKNTLLQGDLAPDLFGIRNRRSADYTDDGQVEIEECFVDPSEIEINYEVRLANTPRKLFNYIK